MRSLEDFMRAWDNVSCPLKCIVLEATGGIVISFEVDDFVLETDQDGNEFIKLFSQGKMKARISPNIIAEIKGGMEE